MAITSDLLTTAQVAARLDVWVGTVNGWARSGRLAPVLQVPGYKGARLFDPAEVEALAVERERRKAARASAA